MKLTFKKIAALGVLALGSMSASAVTLDFENYLTGDQISDGFTGSNVTAYEEDGFTLSSSGDQNEYHTDIFGSAFENDVANGSDNFGWCGSVCFESPVQISINKTNGGSFGLSSIDLAIPYYGNDITDPQAIIAVTVLGFFADNTYISKFLFPTDEWNTYVFSGFDDLIRVDVLGQGPTFVMDNIVLVPEPATLLLLGLGLAGLGFARRKKES